MDMVFEASRRSLEEFLEVYEPGTAGSWRDERGATMLIGAVGNRDQKSRFEISSFLLNNGADATATRKGGTNALHDLVARLQFKVGPDDPSKDIPLLKLLLDAGASPNAYSRRYGTPLEYFVSDKVLTMRDEEQFVPFYNVWFSCPSLDLNLTNERGRSFGVSILEMTALPGVQTPVLRERVLEWFRVRGADPGWSPAEK